MTELLLGQEVRLWADSHNIPIEYFETCSSTNEIAKAESFSPKLAQVPFKLYVTDLQTAGRGRGSHSWHCPKPGQQILMTWSFQLADVPLPTLSPRIGLALWNAVSTTWAALPWGLKPPNDLYLGPQKIAGILLENVIQGDATQGGVRTLIGLGMNILSSPQDLPTSTSLAAGISVRLPSGSPLLSEDIFCFLDRLSLEITQAISVSTEVLSTTDQSNLLWALNRFSENISENTAQINADNSSGNRERNAIQKYTQITEDGTLWQGAQKTSWTEI
jgi:BirA family biotin operon repressor/biotin-[acetyl-CoA-carboxylase] ligase